LGVTIQPSGPVASLIIATSQLKLVQDVIGAMRAADAASGKQFGPLGIEINPAPSGHGPVDQCCCRPANSQDPKYLPRPVIHPTPRYLPRPVYHLTPRVEWNQPPSCLPEESGKVTAHITEAPPPPWKILAWPKIDPPHLKVKVMEYRPDTKGKGTLINLFV
jgi:hypothetical protein